MADVDLDKRIGIASIREIGMVGPVRFSADLKYYVIYDGRRAAPTIGRVALVENDEYLWVREIPKPLDAAVSPQGWVMVCDYLGPQHGTLVWFLDRDGDVVKQIPIEANVLSCHFTPDGSFAVFNSAGSESAIHSGKLFVFRMPRVTPLFTAYFPTKRFQHAVCDAEGIAISMTDILHKFSWDGGLRNGLQVAEADFEEKVKSRWFPSAFYVLEHLATLQTDHGPGRREFLKRGFQTLFITDMALSYRALCARRLGELALVDHNRAVAAVWFREAIRLYPKIGLKRQLLRIEREISADLDSAHAD